MHVLNIGRFANKFLTNLVSQKMVLLKLSCHWGKAGLENFRLAITMLFFPQDFLKQNRFNSYFSFVTACL